MRLSTDRVAAYTGARWDILSVLPPSPTRSGAVVDVGCSNGMLGSMVAAQWHVPVIGVEKNAELAASASERLNRVIVGDATEVIRSLRTEDIPICGVLFGDVLEHLIDPWTCVDAAIDLMPDGGWIVASVPNVAHLDTLVNLLRGTWPMRERGIHDDSHLRFFARRDLDRLFLRSRSSFVAIRRTYRIIERPHRINGFARAIGWVWPNAFTFQFLILLKVQPS